MNDATDSSGMDLAGIHGSSAIRIRPTPEIIVAPAAARQVSGSQGPQDAETDAAGRFSARDVRGGVVEMRRPARSSSQSAVPPDLVARIESGPASRMKGPSRSVRISPPARSKPRARSA